MKAKILTSAKSKVLETLIEAEEKPDSIHYQVFISSGQPVYSVLLIWYENPS